MIGHLYDRLMRFLWPPPLEAGWEVDGDVMHLRGLQLIDPEDITHDVFSRCLRMLGANPDEVLAGEPIDLPEHPPSFFAQAFFDLVCVNSADFDLQGMQWSRANALLGVCVDHFINARPTNLSGRAGS